MSAVGGANAGGGSGSGGLGSGGSSGDLSRLGRAAMGYAKLGWAVFPVQVRGKTPPANGPLPKDASTDLATVEAWWRANPDANIGVATGPRSGIWVIDVNMRIVDGVKAFDKVRAGREWPLTPTQTTGRGEFGLGIQYVFAWPSAAPIVTSIDKLALGVTVRGDGGYVIVPPSAHSSDQAYKWLPELRPTMQPPAQAPEWLLDLVRAATPRVRVKAAPVVAASGGSRTPGGRVAELRVAVDNAKPEPEPVVRWSNDPDVLQHCELKQDGSLKPKSFRNAVALLMYDKSIVGTFRLDTFRNKLVVTREFSTGRPMGGFPRGVKDEDYSRVVMWLEERGVVVNTRTAEEAVKVVAESNQYHPVREWMNALEWDGIERLDFWLIDYMGAPDDGTFVRASGSKWLISSVARIMNPGAKVDTMLILEGDQGIRKSSALEIMATVGGTRYFRDSLSNLGKRDSAIELSGSLIVELAELDAVRKTGIATLNAFLTRRIDNYIPPYGRTTIEVPRQCIFAGTCNPTGAGYWEDSTGGRRIWPIPVKRIDVDGLEGVRDQLWAEAVHRWRQNEIWWFDDPEVVRMAYEAARERIDEDIWTDFVEKFVTTGPAALTGRVTVAEILSDLGIKQGDMNQDYMKRVSKILRSLGFTRSKGLRMPNGGKGNVWMRRAAAAPEEADDGR